MKRTLTFILLAVFVNGYSQTGQTVINSDNFPEISIEWNDYDPETKDKQAFSIIDNEVVRNFDMAYNQKNRNKSVLFLWEDMSFHGLEPYNFMRKTLLEFFRETNLQSGDRFGISVFSREYNNADLLQPLVSGFTNDKNALINAVESYRHNTVTVSEQPKYSDLHKAIFKGIDLFNAEPADNVKVIVVFTVGLNLQGGGAMSETSPVINKAKENHIPIYAALYPLHGTKPGIVDIANETYGKTIDYADAKSQLANIYSTLNRRHSAHEYRFTFKTDTEKEGKQHNVVLLVNDKQQAPVSFSAPVFSLTGWIKENIWLAIGAAVAIIAIIVLTVVLLIKRRKARDEENRANVQANLDRVQQDANVKAEAARREAESAKQQQLSWQQEQERRKREAEECVEQERLSNLMRVKNMYPRLQCAVNGNTFVYNVGQSVTTVGRTDGNDLVLPHQTVSGKHAKIVFTGGGFEIVDLDSTNKVIVNGQFVTRATLKNSDIIGLGEVVITFYL
ncbi:MAG: FHA domain-containing protein [Prevotellaceae bacterium]|jgi:hypothetical protein|nr:FHA domain-containing protein [Prevotellaceae bacterium]